jgi:DnaJ like chaperone protein
VFLRFNPGCLVFLLFAALIGGTPLLVGIARLFLFGFLALALFAIGASWWVRNRALPLARERHDRFVEILVHLLVRLAEVDGNLDRREVTVIRDFFEREFGYSGERLLQIRDLIKTARTSTVTIA